MASFAIFEHSFLQEGSVCRRENKRRASFGSLQRLREAGVVEIAEVPGFGLKTAQALRNFLDARRG